jgi:hypothetical protein
VWASRHLFLGDYPKTIVDSVRDCPQTIGTGLSQDNRGGTHASGESAAFRDERE